LHPKCVLLLPRLEKTYFYLQSAHAKAGVIKLKTLTISSILMFLLTLPFTRRVRKTVKSDY